VESWDIGPLGMTIEAPVGRMVLLSEREMGGITLRSKPTANGLDDEDYWNEGTYEM
jgi:hypothetical protein